MLSSVEMFCWNIYVVAVFSICGEVKISGLIDFSDPVQGTDKERKFIPACLDNGEYLVRYIYKYIFFFRVSFIKHLRFNRTGMRGDNALPMPFSQVDPYLHDFSTACFSRFSLPLINQRSKFEFQMLKTFLFHILHLTQSRVSMG